MGIKQHIVPGGVVSVTSKDYRPDIDGLRAIAVLSVLFYHAHFPGFAGGFLGVDIFFVLSGYLITKHLAKDLEQGRFSIWRFYEKRARRILPALLLVMASTMLAGVVLLQPGYLENLGQASVATLLFANNVLLLITSGYFDVAAEVRPLTHTWSLAVEEHYYLVVPFLMGASWAVAKLKGLRLVIALVTVTSFLAALWLTPRYPDFSFLLLPSRAWQIGVGAMVALVSPTLIARLAARQWLVDALCVVALAAICVPIMLYHDAMPLPGAPTALPVLATGLLLGIGHHARLTRPLLSWRPVVLVGLLSYSAYLWHMPLFAFARLTTSGIVSSATYWALIAVTFLLAYASLRLVETPMRRPQVIPLRPFLTHMAAGTVLLMTAGLGLALTSGARDAYPEWVRADPGTDPSVTKAFVQAPMAYHDVPFDPQSERKLLVVGNSFARDFLNIAEAAKVEASLSYDDDLCAFGNRQGQGWLAAQEADLVILATSHEVPENYECLEAAARKLEDAGMEWAVIGTKNWGMTANWIRLVDEDTHHALRVEPLAAYRDAEKHARRDFGDRLISVMSPIAYEDGTLPVFTPGGLLISEDTRHVTPAGARFLADRLFTQGVLAALPRRTD